MASNYELKTAEITKLRKLIRERAHKASLAEIIEYLDFIANLYAFRMSTADIKRWILTLETETKGLL